MTGDRRQLGQRGDVDQPIAAHVHGEIVAAVFALGADLRRHPPHRRVIEQQRLDHRLQQVDEIVVTADVRELVREDRLQLLGRQARERRRRQQHHRLHPADQRRHHDRARFDDRDGAAKLQSLGDHAGGGDDRRRHRGNRVARQAARQHPSAEQPQRQRQHADAPRQHEHERRRRSERRRPPRCERRGARAHRSTARCAFSVRRSRSRRPTSSSCEHRAGDRQTVDRCADRATAGRPTRIANVAMQLTSINASVATPIA